MQVYHDFFFGTQIQINVSWSGSGSETLYKRYVFETRKAWRENA